MTMARQKMQPVKIYERDRMLCLKRAFFMGKLGRENVILIADSNIEVPSDLQGVVYTSKTMWQTDVLRELKAIGYNVDFNKLFA